MIQLNLLPDVKLQYIKAQRSRRLLMSTSILVSAGAVGLLLLLLAANGLQGKHLRDLTRDINTNSAKLQSQPQINKILTVQNQLGSLTALHAGKPAAARVFDYLNQVTPSNVAINNFNIDFTKQTATITGSADALSSVNKYVDTLKFTTYTTSANKQSPKAFSNVVLSSFALATGAQNAKPATYTITLVYDRNIFDISQTVKLSVPTQTTTHSGLNQPNDLFEAAPPPASSKGSQ